ncbi:C4-dicarboxylate ABC transporter substrate-binding protein [Cohnella kolymensis]|uniref:C4-dicarboxylate ABC transporter substrate-binding protein n=1 Tax=Cohnella kolymensis TaxID=1590652 RepID=A0ABR5A9A6_9BACL|nr:TRAP transporter substrate-binding protein [Cohnella kolymensis]KIL37588.1 C4-dicarboxylate ABC transporter substrate-binding protein [Cohnella kolymensis]
MFKKITGVVMTALLAVSVAACGSSKPDNGSSAAPGGSAASGGTGKNVTLRLGHITGESDAWHKGALKFAELVKEKSNGSVTVEVYPSSTLGNDRDMIEGMQMGSVDFALVAGVLSNFYEPYSILELPYLFRDKDHLEKVLYGDVGTKLKKDLLDNAQVRGLEFWVRGPRELTANKKIEKVEDLKGLKIRVPEIPASIAAWKAMGASPTPMAFGEVYSSLQTGVIDAQENPFALIASNKIQEVQSHLMLTNHVYGYVLLTMSDMTYQKLSPDQQKAVEEAAKEATQFENDLVAKNEEELLKTLKDSGMEVVELDTAPFAEKAKTVHAEFAKKYGQELYDSIINTK